jgi:hypothetical protein
MASRILKRFFNISDKGGSAMKKRRSRTSIREAMQADARSKGNHTRTCEEGLKPWPS